MNADADANAKDAASLLAKATIGIGTLNKTLVYNLRGTDGAYLD